jgi:hypothetical protein
VRVVPSIERGEAVNVGIILFCRPRRFLQARVELDEAVVRALAPGWEPSVVRAHLDAIARIGAGDETAGPITRLSQSERFHWLVAPSSTMVQISAVHTGLTADPAATLDHLFRALVERPAAV